jgi:hypothetical protein
LSRLSCIRSWFLAVKASLACRHDHPPQRGGYEPDVG